jgi:large subunit ribosomal protein L17
MRHGKKVNHLGRTHSHRAAMLSNMACSLIEHKRITTTIAKAKALRVYVEPILTKSKDDTTHARRTAFSYLKSKESVTELFRVIAPKIADRPGGYTRIIRTGYRLGDNAEMCMIELVDFNEIYGAGETKKTTTRRSRRGGSTTAPKAATAPAADATETAVEEAPEAVVEETPAATEEAPVAEAEVVEETPAAEVVEEAPAAEAATEEAPAADETPEAPADEEKKDEA